MRGLPHHTSLPVGWQRVRMRNDGEVSSWTSPCASFICIVSFPYRKFSTHTHTHTHTHIHARRMRDAAACTCIAPPFRQSWLARNILHFLFFQQTRQTAFNFLPSRLRQSASRLRSSKSLSHGRREIPVFSYPFGKQSLALFSKLENYTWTGYQTHLAYQSASKQRLRLIGQHVPKGPHIASV